MILFAPSFRHYDGEQPILSSWLASPCNKAGSSPSSPGEGSTASGTLWSVTKGFARKASLLGWPHFFFQNLSVLDDLDTTLNLFQRGCSNQRPFRSADKVRLYSGCLFFHIFFKNYTVLIKIFHASPFVLPHPCIDDGQEQSPQEETFFLF